jgi:carotenoid cleavage dioxygenase-like enzyme
MVTFRTLQGQKDTANTVLAEHGGRLLALMEQAPPTEIQVHKNGKVQTLQSMARLNGAISSSDPITGGSFGAHGRTCTETGDRIHVSYASSAPPFARVDIFSQEAEDSAESTGWNLKQSIPVYLPTGTPVMLHDCAITSNYALVVDFPLTIRPKRMLSDRFPVEYEPKNGARIGLVPRRGTETRIPRPNPIFAGLIAILA